MVRGHGTASAVTAALLAVYAKQFLAGPAPERNAAWPT
jgi:hypothetical protein